MEIQKLQVVEVFVTCSSKRTSGDACIALAVLRTSLHFWVREIIAMEQIAVLSRSSTLDSVVTEQGRVYTNT